MSDEASAATVDEHTALALDRLIDTAVAAFLDDPLYHWLQPDRAARALLLRDNFGLTLAAGVRNAQAPPRSRG